ncbi:alpha/beta fold hydrolase [Lichenicola sp.]|uniref:alpha/beta fold hydrolase n=1 Tax=Lichenicola sp. TaxID=2804529 RepID=UPI003B006DD5
MPRPSDTAPHPSPARHDRSLFRRRAVRSVLALGVAAGALAAAGAAFAQAPPTLPAFDQEPYTHPQRLVAIAPGRRLNLYCTGHGAPAVILDSGWGGPTTAWAYVQPAVSAFTEVCSYDRAGQGFSDPGPLPRDTRALVSDLHALLHKAGIRPPYILVAHSLGGLDGVMFADRYRSELAGMLLVDPAFAHQGREMSHIPGIDAVMKQTNPDLKPCEAAARAHRLPTTPQLVDLCLSHDPSYTPALVSALDAMALRPEYWSDVASETASFESGPGSTRNDLDSRELDAAARGFGALPLIVLTAGDRIALPGITPAQADAEFAVWKHGHDVISARSAQGRNQVVPNTSHYIQFYQPATVIAAIHELVDRSGRKPGKG